MENEKIEKALDRAAELEDMGAAFAVVRGALNVPSHFSTAFISAWEESNDLKATEFWHRAPKSNRRAMLAEYVEEVTAAALDEIAYKTHAGIAGGFMEPNDKAINELETIKLSLLELSEIFGGNKEISDTLECAASTVNVAQTQIRAN